MSFRAPSLKWVFSRCLSPLLLLAMAASLLGTAGTFGQVAPGSGRFIGVDELTPGMRGYGLTVFRGVTPERFDVEVIDVLHHFRPDQDLILIRVSHPILDHARVVAGMSGSPVYFDGRLAGAYAYGWSFSNDSVAGVTPIASMARELRRPVQLPALMGSLSPTLGGRIRPASGPASARVAPMGLPAYLGADQISATSALSAHSALSTHSARTTTPGAADLERSPAARALLADGSLPPTLAAVSTPLMVGGLSDSVVRMLAEQLQGVGLTVLQAAGSGPTTPSANAPTQYVVGGAVGVQLTRGDMATTAVGTVTHVSGSRLVAFGHPMLNAGETGLPTAIARVLHILSSRARSFKISEPVRSLGALVHDRQSAIVVDSSVVAPTVDVHLQIQGAPEAVRTEWNMTLASHRVLTPVLLNAALVNALKAAVSDTSDVMFEATSRVWISGRTEPFVLRDVGHSRAGVANPMALSQLRLFSVLEAVYGNPFEVARVERVDVTLSLRFARETIQIVDASVPHREVDPGASVPLRVVLRPYGQPEVVRVFPFTVPERLAGQTVQISVGAGRALRLQQIQPRNLNEVLQVVRHRLPASSMVISLRNQSRGLRLGGHVVEHLPASVLDSLQFHNDSDRNRPFMTFDRLEHDLGAIVSGQARLEISVRQTPRP